MSESSEREELRDQAIAWHVRVQSDDAAPADWTALAEWLEASPEHLAAYDEVERLSAELTQAADLIGRELGSEFGRSGADVVPFRPRLRPSQPAPRRVFAVVAAALAAASVTGLMLLQGHSHAPTVDYATGRGETRELTLADGSHVRLDADSRIAVTLGRTERRVAMGEAQASFDVAKDPNRPFLVRFGDEQVRVVGTEFNISHFGGRSVLTVRRGVVQATRVGGPGAEAWRLTRGEALRHVDGTQTFELAAVDPDDAFAWAQGRLVADNRPLSEIAAELSRRYAVPVRVLGAAAARRFSGVLALQGEDATVKTFARLTGLKAARTRDGYVLR